MSRYTQEQRWDHDRDLRKHEPSPRFQKRAVQRLVGYLHGILHDGLLPLSPEVEKALRSQIRSVCVEFEIDALPERAPAEAISRVMLREPT